MSRWTERLHRRITPAEGAIWAIALLSVSAVCAAAAIVAPDWSEPAGAPAPQAAVMIELAPEPEAVETETSRITEDRQDAAERPAPADPAPTMTPEPPAETARAETAPEQPPVMEKAPPAAARPPPPGPQPPAIDPLEAQMLAALTDVDVPVPLARPLPRPRPPAEKPAVQKAPKTKAERKTQREPASAAAEKPAAPVRASNRNRAEKTVASSSVARGDSNRWKARVVAHLERRKRYPSAARARGEQGTVLVAFRIDAGGRVLSASLARSSGHSALDEAALAMVERASPVPAPPSGEGTTLTAPVRFVRR